jgi:glutathione-specific gamma-glutamylcyclotransferase
MNDTNSIQMHNVSGRYTKPAVVTRALLDFGGMTAIYMQDAPGLRLLTEEERAESVASILAMRPYGDVWIFGYGSLIWNPAFKTVERRTARVEGLHRSFCMSIIAGQASPSWPGLMLGLDKAGHCLGSAFRLDEADVAPELTLLLRREMLCRGAYIPRWLELTGEDWHSGMRSPSRSTLRVRSIAGDMPTDTAVGRPATASGGLGSCSDYLFQTRDGLRAHGIPDPSLERLAIRVEAAQMGDAVSRAA